MDKLNIGSGEGVPRVVPDSRPPQEARWLQSPTNLLDATTVDLQILNFWVEHVGMAHCLELNIYLCVCVCVCTLGVSALVDEMARLSDSTSEERSLSSYTSESFDDNGKTPMLKQLGTPRVLNLWIFLMHYILCTSLLHKASKSYSKEGKNSLWTVFCIWKWQRLRATSVDRFPWKWEQSTLHFYNSALTVLTYWKASRQKSSGNVS